MKAQAAIVTIACLAGLSVVTAKPLTELKFDLANFDTDNVDCKSNLDLIDECGLQQGFSHRFDDFAYPTNHTFLMSSCKRQSDAMKCLRAASKCLPPLPKQVLLAMVGSRQKYNKKICAEKPTDAATKFLELNECMLNNKVGHEKGLLAEMNSITTPEAIVGAKIDNVQDRIKYSCCSVAKARKEYLDATVPHCKQYTSVASDVIDSYLAETVGIICPDFEKLRSECEKLPKLNIQKSSSTRFFIRPILNVIQTLA